MGGPVMSGPVMSGEFVGVLPAAGRGSRLAPLRYPKELLPITYEPAPGGDDEAIVNLPEWPQVAQRVEIRLSGVGIRARKQRNMRFGRGQARRGLRRSIPSAAEIEARGRRR